MKFVIKYNVVKVVVEEIKKFEVFTKIVENLRVIVVLGQFICSVSVSGGILWFSVIIYSWKVVFML